MRILVLNYEYPPVGGGGGAMCARVCEGLAAHGHEIRVVTSGLKGLPRREFAGGVEIFRPRTWRRKPDTCTIPEMGLYVALAFPEALRQALSWKPHVAHAHFVVPTGPLALLLRQSTGLPYVVTAHLGDVPGGVPEQTKRAFRLVAPAARAVWRAAAARTAVSTHVASLAESAYGIRPVLVPNGVPAVPPPPSLAPGTPPRMLFVGRLSVQKNPLLALKACALIRDLDWELEFVGDGPLEAAARSQAGALGLGGRVRFSGWREPRAVREAMAGADILLLPSLHEGMPMAAIEALWHGLAIVATRIPGVRDVVREGENGVLADPEPEAFAAAIRSLLADRQRLASARAASRARAATFDVRACVTSYERLLSGAARKL